LQGNKTGHCQLEKVDDDVANDRVVEELLLQLMHTTAYLLSKPGALSAPG